MEDLPAIILLGQYHPLVPQAYLPPRSTKKHEIQLLSISIITKFELDVNILSAVVTHVSSTSYKDKDMLSFHLKLLK